MFFALLALAALPDLVPARWTSGNPETLELLRGTPINCILLERQNWTAAFNQKAREAGLTTMAVIRPSGDPVAAARQAIQESFPAAVLDGPFDPAVRLRIRRMLEDSKLQVVELMPRSDLRFDSPDPVIGTNQGVWPGVQTEQDGKAKAAPSGAPWIDTNTGFLRFVKAATKATVWLGNTPPSNQTFPMERYLQAVGDAAMTGARWVIAFDSETNRKLLARDKRTLEGWNRLAETLRYYEEHKEWRRAEPFAQLALVEDSKSGALLSGGILDMIAVKHTPVRPVPPSRLASPVIEGVRLAVNVDPDALTPEQRDVLRAFTRSGGTLLTGPPGWKFPVPRPGQIALEKDDLNKLDEIWKELNSMTGRRNLGARLFNVSTMLSNLVESADRSQIILQIVNYSDYPVDNVTVHVLGRYKAVSLLRPGAPPLNLTSYDVEEGTGVDIDQVRAVATLILTR